MPLSLKQSPPYNLSLFRPVRPKSPSFSSLSSLMSSEQQTTPTSPTSAKVSSLARRIHGWSWQAVRFLEDDESRYHRCSDAISPLVSHWNGHWVSGPPPYQTPWVIAVERTSKGRLCDPFWGEEPFELPLTSRARILLPQHRTIPVEHLNVNVATLLCVPCFLFASRSLTAPSL
jgi:hypothetical protein